MRAGRTQRRLARARLRTVSWRVGLSLALLACGPGRAQASGGSARGGAAAAPTQQPRFKTAADAVEVDVTVLDEQGRPVRGLAREDFFLDEDGVPQELETFRAEGGLEEDAGESRLADRVSTNTGKDRAGRRTFAIVVDDVHLTDEGARRARAALLAFLDGLRPGDQVGLVSTGGGPGCTGRIGRDGEGLRAAVSRVKGLRPPELRGADQITDYEAKRIVLHNDAVVLKRVSERWTRDSKLWEQTWGADSAPAASGPGSALASRGPRSALGSASSDDQAVLALANQVYQGAKQRQERVLGALQSVVSALGAAPGRKTVILLTERFLVDDTGRQLVPLSAASRRANAPIYVVDLGGGLFEPDLQADRRRLEDRGPALDERNAVQASVTTLAEDCGGFAITGTSDLASGLSRVAAESTDYYLLGYQPTNRAWDGGFRRIHVTVRRPGVRVRARSGYFAVAGAAAPDGGSGSSDAARRLREAMESPIALPGVGLRLSTYTFGAGRGGTVKTLLVSELRLDDLTFERKEGRFAADLDVLLTVTQYATGRSLGDRPVGLRLSAPAEVKGQNAWHRVTQEVELLPGPWLAKIVVRDRTSGVVGSVGRSIDVPSAGAWRTSSPVLSDAVSEEGKEGRHALPLARRVFAAAGLLYCEVEVYGARVDGTTGLPRIASGYELVRAGGVVERREAPVPLPLGPDRRVGQLLAIPLRGLRPGDYDLVLHLADRVAGRTTQLREPFSLVRPPGPTPALYRDLLQDYVDGRKEDAVASLVAWPSTSVASLARELGPEDGLARAAVLLHTDAALTLLAGRDPSHSPVQLEIARGILARTSPASSFRREWLLAMGYQLQARGDAVGALRFYRECQQAFPRAAVAWLAAGTVYEWSAFPDGLGGARVVGASGDLVGEAKAQYRQALVLDPGLVEGRVRLGRLLQRAGEREEARKTLEEALAQGGNDPVLALAHLFLGDLQEREGETEKAALHYRAALERNPALQPAALALADVQRRRGDRAGARETLTRALRSGCPAGTPEWLTYYLGLGVRAASALHSLREDSGS